MKNLLIALLFCSMSPLFGQIQIFENQEQDFSIEYPTNWMLSDFIMNEVAFAAYTLHGNKTQEKIVADVKTFKTFSPDVATCTRATIEMLNETHSDLAVEKCEETQLAGKKSYSIVYQYSLPPLKKGIFAKKRIIKAKSYVIVRENKEYLITFTTEKKLFDSFEPVFDKMAASFQFVLRMNA